MRVRMYILAEKGTEEGHIDYSPPYKDHKNKIYGSTLRLCVGGSFSMKASEILQVAKVVEALDKIYKDIKVPSI